MNVMVVLSGEVRRQVLHATGVLEEEIERGFACPLGCSLIFDGDLHAGAFGSFAA